MFLITAYKSKLWTDLDSGSRNLRIFILAGIIYIIIHSYLYSSYTKNMSFVLNQRYLIYFLLITDIMLTFIDYMTTKDKLKEKKVNLSYIPYQRFVMTRKPIQDIVKQVKTVNPIKTVKPIQNTVKEEEKEKEKETESIKDNDSVKSKEELTSNDFIETETIPVYEP